MDNSNIWSSQPKVRNACEECHKRKIKCIMSEDGGACRACKSATRNCFFLPRQKCGRVPKKASKPVEESAAPSPMAFSPTDISTEFLPMDPTSTGSLYSTFGPGYLTPTMQIGESAFFDENMEMPFADLSGEHCLTASETPSRSSRSSSTHGSTRMQFTRSHTSLQSLDWQLTQAQTPTDPISEEHERLFAQLLHACHEMQKQNEILANTSLLGDANFGTQDILQSTISSVDTICHAILEVAGDNHKDNVASRGMPDNKLLSVTMAATFAVFEICEALVTTSATSFRQCSESTLMWKRLDLNLTQIRVSLSRLLQTSGPYLSVIKSAVSRAKMLDNIIKSTVQDGYSDWEDGM